MIARWQQPCRNPGCDRPIEPGEEMARTNDGSGFVHLSCEPGSLEWWLVEAAERALVGAPGGWPA